MTVVEFPLQVNSPLRKPPDANDICAGMQDGARKSCTPSDGWHRLDLALRKKILIAWYLANRTTGQKWRKFCIPSIIIIGHGNIHDWVYEEGCERIF